MTRAAERLVVAGSLGPRARGVVPPDSWHEMVRQALSALGCAPVDDPLWGSRIDYAPVPAAPIVMKAPVVAAAPPAAVTLPAWLYQPAPPEARPPRPLSPSSLGADQVSNPPPGPALAAAAERGRLLHALFERLPAIAPADRRAAGLRWLGARDGADALIDAALQVIDDPALAPLFAPGALTEAPLAGVVDGVVISGTVDRLIVTDDAVIVIDYKTGRRVPATLSAISDHHLRQMAAYVAVVAQVFPGRIVTGMLLYSEGPVLHRLPADLLALHKPGFGAQDDKLGGR
jgi:ATP-dependent helicase/nuclease subunit A